MARESESEIPQAIDSTDRVSVIIPTRNSSKTIGKCLSSIKKQTYKNLEVFVIDSFSTDRTSEIATTFKANLFLLNAERAEAKNFGLSKATGEFLLFIDSDMILQPYVIGECVRICSTNSNVAAIIIPERSIGSGFWIRVRDFERSLYKGSKIESPRFFVKKFVTNVGGFDAEVVAYEESTLPQKIENLGLDVSTRITSLILHDEEGFNLSKWLQKKRYYSISAKLYSKKYRKYSKMQLSISYRIRVLLARGNWKILMGHPILSFGVLVLKTLEYLYSIRI